MKTATSRAEDQLPPTPDDDVRIPENVPGDRYYPPGSRIVGGTLELPPTGQSDADKIAEAVKAAAARRDGVSFSVNGVELGARSVPGDDELAAITARASEKKELSFSSVVGSAPISRAGMFLAALDEETREAVRELVFSDTASLLEAVEDEIVRHSVEMKRLLGDATRRR